MQKTIFFFITTILLSSIVSAIEEPKAIVIRALPTHSVIYFFEVNIKEPLQLLFAKDKVQKKLDFLEKRKLELIRISRIEPATDQEKIRLIKWQAIIEEKRQRLLRELEDDAENLDEEQKIELRDILQKHIDRLNEVLEEAPEQAKSGLENAINASSRVINRIESKITQITKKAEITGSTY